MTNIAIGVPALSYDGDRNIAKQVKWLWKSFGKKTLSRKYGGGNYNSLHTYTVTEKDLHGRCRAAHWKKRINFCLAEPALQFSFYVTFLNVFRNCLVNPVNC